MSDDVSFGKGKKKPRKGFPKFPKLVWGSKGWDEEFIQRELGTIRADARVVLRNAKREIVTTMGDWNVLLATLPTIGATVEDLAPLDQAFCDAVLWFVEHVPKDTGFVIPPEWVTFFKDVLPFQLEVDTTAVHTRETLQKIIDETRACGKKLGFKPEE
jgi:hypothetical protein